MLQICYVDICNLSLVGLGDVYLYFPLDFSRFLSCQDLDVTGHL